MKLISVMPDTRPEPESAYEDEHVHQVYNQIASHFSSTRFKVIHYPDMVVRPWAREVYLCLLVAMACSWPFSSIVTSGIGRSGCWLWEWEISYGQKRCVYCCFWSVWETLWMDTYTTDHQRCHNSVLTMTLFQFIRASQVCNSASTSWLCCSRHSKSPSS